MHETTDKALVPSDKSLGYFRPSLTGLQSTANLVEFQLRSNLELQEIHLDYVGILRRQSLQDRSRRRLIKIDSRYGGLGAFKNDVFHLLHIDLFGLDCVEHLR